MKRKSILKDSSFRYTAFRMTKNQTKKMKRILRYIIAIIFIASGFCKSIDVKGFSFKLEEYFSPDVFNLTFYKISR